MAIKEEVIIATLDEDRVIEELLERLTAQTRMSQNILKATRPMRWTKEKPTMPGWYWCKNTKPTEESKEGFLACVYIEKGLHGLWVHWMTEPGEAGYSTVAESWPETTWAGPIAEPVE